MDAAEVAREVNLNTLAMGMQLGAADGHAEFSFVCQCGCMERVSITSSEYLAKGGAWLEGHAEPDSAVGIPAA
jgi:hypothetical protein